ncbi:MAG: DUF948 domain-containing protein [Cyanobacteria bacterium]|nr:DUF948 domain-containing protein [Cyanobacteriota bacterium]MDW8199834.1 DUF948 domain-containing protein [Cyanobacteriota bacterium SKYGB_h_bin112]
MLDPLFFLGLSILLVAVSLTAVLVIALPTMLELARAARSVEKLADTLMRELPPTLEAIRLTGLEISDLTGDVSQGVQHAGRVVKRVDDGLTTARSQASRLQITTRSFLVGARAAWNSLVRSRSPRRASRRSRSLTHQHCPVADAANPTPPSRQLPKPAEDSHPAPQRTPSVDC